MRNFRILFTFLAIVINLTESIGQICSKEQLPLSLQQGLVAYYPFCGNTNDESGFGNHIQNFGATLVNDQLGTTNAAYRFDGISTYMQIPYSSSFEALTDNFTFSFWIKNNKTSPYDAMHIIHRNDGCFTFGVGGYSELIYTRQGQAILLISDSTLKNEWTHVLFTMNGLTKSLYLNGVLNKTVITNVGVINLVGAAMKIGIADPGGNGGAYRLDADISQMMWYNRVLTAEEVSLLYNSLGGIEKDCEAFSQINLFSDTTTIVGSTAKLSVAKGYSSYLWNTGDTSSSINVSTSGLYIATVQTQEGCTLSDSTYFILNNLEIVASDTLLCDTAIINLSVPVDMGSFKFVGSFGESDYFIDTVSRSWPQAREAARAQGMDLWVIENQVENDSVYSKLPHAENVYVNYWIGLYQDRNGVGYSEPLGGWKWVNGTPLSFSNWLGGEPNNTSGFSPFYEDYGIMWTKPYHGKWNDYYSEIQDPGIIGQFKTLAVAERSRKKYTWSTGDTTSSVSVKPLLNTDYILSVEDNGIIFTDTISIKVSPKVEFNPLPDTMSVCGDSVILDAGSGYHSYVWSTGDTTPKIVSRFTGLYSVFVKDVNGCNATDTSFLSIVNADINVSDSVICVGESSSLKSNSILLSEIGQFFPDSLSNGIVAAFPFNGNANDQSGNGNRGSVFGASLTEDRFGKLNSAYNFNGSSYISSAIQNLPIGNEPRTISCWVKWDSLNAVWDQRVLNYGACPPGSGGGTFGFTVWDTTGRGNPGNANLFLFSCGATDVKSDIKLGKEWQNLVATYDGNIQKLYLDGRLVGSRSNVLNTVLTPLIIGGNEILSSIGYFKGKIDDIFIWNRALSSQEIEAVKNLSQNYSLLWSNGDTTSSITVSPRETTTYTLTVTDGITTCTDQVTITVNQVDTSLTALDTTAICVGGSARLQAGTGASYVWLKNGTVVNGASSSLYSTTSAGSYRVIVTNASGCSDTSAVITITERPVPVSGTISGGGVAVCSGTNSTAMTLTGSVGTIRWQWSLDSLVFTDIANATSSGYTATNLTRTTYYRVITTNSCGSYTSLVVKVLVNPKPVPSFTVNTASQVLTNNSFVFTNTSTGGSTYLWRFGNGATATTQNATYSYSAVGSYVVRLIVTSAAGCKDSTSSTVTVTAPPPPPPPPPVVSGNLFALNTTCAQFNGNTGTALTRLCYTVSSGRVNAVTPASFMYYVKVTAQSASFTVNIAQSVSRSGFRLFTVNTAGSVASGDNCARVTSVSSPSTGQASVSITRATVGRTYIIGVRYDTRSLVGYTTNGTLNASYSFVARIGNTTLPNSTGSVMLYPNNCVGVSGGQITARLPELGGLPGAAAGVDKTGSDAKLQIRIYPNPSNRRFTVLIESSDRITKGTLRIMNAQGQVVEELKNVQPGSELMIGMKYMSGTYTAVFIQSNQTTRQRMVKY